MEIGPIGSNFLKGPDIVEPGSPQQFEQSFMETLKNSIDQVNDIQTYADQTISDLMAGKQQDLHETMVALEKADLTFQLMMQVRNKIISGYEEIFRMQI